MTQGASNPAATSAEPRSAAAPPQGEGWQATLALRDKVRDEMPRLVGEPDLYYENGAFTTGPP